MRLKLVAWTPAGARTLALPVARHCRTSRITKLTLTWILAAVERRDAPASTDRTIRTRKSSE
jgi:hypothetical protein